MVKPSPFRRVLAAAAAITAAAILWAPPAFADQVYRLGADTYVQNTPSGLVTGNVQSSWTFALQSSSPSGDYGYGRFYGPGVSKCGWIKYSNVNLTYQGSGSANCASSVGDVGDWYNSYSGSGVTDGRYIGAKSCPAYLNVSGYGSGGGVGATTTSGQGLFYRYTTNDGNYVMVRDTGRSGNNWLFVPTSCLGPPPSTYKEFYSDRAFVAVNGKYVTAEGGGGAGCYLIARADQPLQWETFKTNAGNQFNNGTIMNIQVYNGQWVFADQGGSAGIGCDRTSASAWETFQPFKLNSNGTDVIGDGDQFAMRTWDGVHYWTAENAGASPLNATRTGAGPWETFTMRSVARAYP